MVLRAAAATVGAVGALVGMPFVAVVAAGGTSAAPTPEALADIPADYLALYRDAAGQRCPALPWSVLAAIGKIESDHGRIGGARLQPDGRVEPPIIGIALDGAAGTATILDTDGGLHDRDELYDRAVGPMQFIPTTWAGAGIDASGDGLADPHNAIDAVHAAADYLCSAGVDAPSGFRDAIWAYNHSWAYVEQVLAQAERYAAGGAEVIAASPTLVALVLANSRLDIYPAGRADIADGRIDARVLIVLQLATERHTLRVSSLKTGHSRCVGGGDHNDCRVSHHWYGRAVDISAVDGQPVSAGSPAARALVRWLAELPEPLRPSETGSPFADLAGLPGMFSDSDHQAHIHLGYRRTER